MTKISRALADTSVFIAREQHRPIRLEKLPQEIVVSVVTVAELYAGVLAAGDTTIRARRLATLEALASIEVLPIDEKVAHIWAELRVTLAERNRRINVNDLWIGATAIANNIPVISQDDDFNPLEEGARLTVIKV